MARSRSLAALTLVPLAGCDLVFDISVEAEPCELGSFEGAASTDFATAEDFSVDWQMTFAVVTSMGLTNELDLTTNALTPIDLGPSFPRAFSLAPEGSSMFYTASSEPLLLKGALRPSAAQWLLDAGVPRATYAGTPSADVFGPRRLLVRERETSSEILELEDVAGHWMQVGEPHPLVVKDHAPNLTPDGLTMVWLATDENGVVSVLAAQRPSIAEWFGPPTTLRTGAFSAAQLLGECKQLYVTEPAVEFEPAVLRRYER